MTCRVCGCTDERACDEGCYWVEEELCSRCTPQQADAAVKLAAVAQTNGHGRPAAMRLRGRSTG